MKYCVSVNVWASANLTVEADSPEDALSIFERRHDTTLCHQCCGHIEIADVDWDSVLVTDEAGGERIKTGVYADGDQ